MVGKRETDLKTGFRAARLEALGLAAWGTLADSRFSAFRFWWHGFGTLLDSQGFHGVT